MNTGTLKIIVLVLCAVICASILREFVVLYRKDFVAQREEITRTPNEFEARDVARKCLDRGWTYQITVRYDLTAGESSAPTDFTIACRRFDP